MRKLSLVFVFVVLALLAGCTNKGKVQGVTETEIIVGNCATTSGAMSAVGIPFNAGIEAYIKMVNDAGGVNGRTIKFIHTDDEGDNAKAKACIDGLINDEKVFAIVGHFGSGAVAATLDDIKEAGIPSVYFASGLSSLYNEKAEDEDRGIFPVQPILVMEGRLMVARAVAETNAKKIGAIYTNDDAGTDMITGIRNQVQKLGDGYTLVEQQVTVGANDYSAAVTKMKNDNVDVVIVATIQGTFTPIIKELAKQNNTKPAFTTYNNADATLIGLVKEDLGTKFDVYANAWVDVSDATSLNLFATEIVESSGQATYAGNAFSMAGWIAGHFFVEGLKAVPEDEDLTWDSYMDALESKPIKNPFGGQISFADGQRYGTEEMSLLKLNPTGGATGAGSWDAHKPIANIDEILGE